VGVVGEKRFVLFLILDGSKSLIRYIIKKAFPLRKALNNICGLDGTRTRDPMRDRHVF
jgi:hypothetical protein